MITKEQAGVAAMEFLKSHVVGVLATTDIENQPFASPVYYAVQQDFSIYFATSHHTQKFKNLVLNKKVAFCVGTGPEYTVVNVHGTATMTDAKEREAGMKVIGNLVGKPMSSWPIKTVKLLETGGLALFKITPVQVSFLDLPKEGEVKEEDVEYLYEVFP
jgi:nitroimidazol reductase NimA-like FMN-containing flavoprotein (pyridoxamine 5'-phosphate oxidase superfamily)